MNNVKFVFHQYNPQKGASTSRDSSPGETSSNDSSVREHETKSRKTLNTCSHCKSLKVRCERVPGKEKCKRCIAGNYECTARLRKQRTVAPTHEDLQLRSMEQDRQINSLIQQLDEIKVSQKLSKWADQANDFTARAKDIQGALPPNAGGSSSSSSRRSGLVASTSNLHPSRSVGQVSSSSPNILKCGVIQPHEVLSLFNLFFQKINPFFTLLDPELHTPERVYQTSQFLFTVVCATASQYHVSTPELQSVAMDILNDEVGSALVNGPKTIETCQGLLIVGMYPVPQKKFCHDRSWLFMGAAIRLAQEIGLDRHSMDDIEDRETLNRRRTWVTCFCVDMMQSIQFGKMPFVSNDDYIARKAQSWCLSSPLRLPYDLYLGAYTDFLLLLGGYLKLTGPTDNLARRIEEGFDLDAAVISYDKQLCRRIQFWEQEFRKDPKISQHQTIAYRAYKTKMNGVYLRLVILSQGFQYAVKRGISRNSYIVQNAISAAQEVIKIMVEYLYPMHSLRYAMTPNFLSVTFAAAFLLNLLRPSLRTLLTPDQPAFFSSLVQALVGVLDQVILSARHPPAKFSKLLSLLLQKYGTFGRPTSAASTSRTSYPDRSPSSSAYAWPDTTHYPSAFSAERSASMSAPIQPGSIAYPQPGEPIMDLSVRYFAQTAFAATPPRTSSSSPSEIALRHQNSNPLHAIALPAGFLPPDGFEFPPATYGGSSNGAASSAFDYWNSSPGPGARQA